jgi:hypothetical protein
MKTFPSAKLLASIIFFFLFVINVSAQPFGNALSLTETSKSHVVTNSSLGNFGTGDFTIELWTSTTSTAPGIFFSKRASCSSPLNFITGGITGSKLFLEISGTNYNILSGTSTSIIDGKWHHVAFVRKGITAFIYLDGKLEAGPFSLVGAPNINNTAAFDIGSSPLCPHWFTGSIDEMRIYKKALAENAIAADMYSPVAFVSADLVASYNFDQGIAGGTNTGLTTLADQSGNNNTGTLTSFALTGPASNWIKSYAITNPAIGGTAANGVGQTFTFNFQPPTGDTTAPSFNKSYRPTIMPVSCTLDKLYMLGEIISGSPNPSTVVKVAIFKNGVQTAMAATVSLTNIGQQVIQADLSHPIAVAEGDLISIALSQTNAKTTIQVSVSLHAQ